MSKRIYICHTFYHVYVALLKECYLSQEERGQADIVLSTMSTDFKDLDQRLKASGFFGRVILFDEKRHTYFPELTKYRKDRGNIIFNMFWRILYTKKYAKLEAPFIPVDLKMYGDIYVFCDSDPIGYYLNARRIPYHAVEDGLNTIRNFDSARYDNRGCFSLKAFMSEKLNLIFIQNGYGKYCIDMEVNDISLLKYSYHKYIEVSRKMLVEHLTQKDKDKIVAVFVKNVSVLYNKMNEGNREGKNCPKILILTEPICQEDTRIRMFRDMIAKYGEGAQIYFKPHPIDTYDYAAVFPEHIVFAPSFPMEMFQLIPGLRFAKVLCLLTDLEAVEFADEVIRLGADFVEQYEDLEILRPNEKI